MITTKQKYAIEFYNQIKGSSRLDRTFEFENEAASEALAILKKERWENDKSPYKWESFRVIPVYELSVV